MHTENKSSKFFEQCRCPVFYVRVIEMRCQTDGYKHKKQKLGKNVKNKDNNIIQTTLAVLTVKMVTGFEASVFYLFSNNKNIIEKAHTYITENVKLQLGSLLVTSFNWGVGPINKKKC